MTSFSCPVSHAVAMLLASSCVRGSLLYWQAMSQQHKDWDALSPSFLRGQPERVAAMQHSGEVLSHFLKEGDRPAHFLTEGARHQPDQTNRGTA